MDKNHADKFAEFLKIVDPIDELDGNLRDEIFDHCEYEHGIPGRYEYIPFGYAADLFDLFYAIKFVLKKPEARFLDVGAGTGRIVKLAKLYGFSACGVEFHAPYVTAGRKAHELSEGELIIADAFNLQKEFIEKFDIIYTYMPIYTPDKMSELHFHLYKNAHPGAIFVEMLPQYYPMNQFHESAAEIFDKHVSFSAVVKSF